jgi:hypothetical protein
MMRSKTLNLNGLQLSGEQPVSPRTNAFLKQHDLKAEQKDGYVSLGGVNGGFCLDGKFRQDVQEFNTDKDAYVKKHQLKL